MKRRILTGLLSLCLMILELSAQDAIVTRDSRRQVEKDYTRFYIGKTEGVTVDGSFLSGLNGAYFFSRQIGAGLVFRTGFTKSEFDEPFFGAAFFANLGPKNPIVYFPLRLGFGAYDGENGWYAAAGIAFRPARVFSIGLNFDYASDDFKKIDMEYYLGINLTFGFHF